MNSRRQRERETALAEASSEVVVPGANSFFDILSNSLRHDKRVKSATVVDIASGAIISTTCPTLSDAALVATHAPSIVSRASLCAECTDGDASDGILLVCISSRLGELLMCADSQRRWAVLVEQEL